MSNRLAFTKLSLRITAPALARSNGAAHSILPAARYRRPAAVPQSCRSRQALQLRWQSSLPERAKVYGFKEVKALVESPSTDQILIDVREPDEYAAGFIPTALNMPIDSEPAALSLTPDEFRDRFGFTKPPPSKEMVFYCKAGIRSSTAAQLALQNGYQKVAEYPGSWLDWEENDGETSLDSKAQGSPAGVPGGD